MSPAVTVFIPTLNAGAELGELLAILRAQRGVELEILVTDSSSDDGVTRAILADSGLSFETIDRADFDHGETRNAAARRASGDLVAFLSQDALPLHEDYLAELARPFADPRVAGAFAAQLPRDDAHPFQLLNLGRHMAEAGRYELREPIDRATWDAMPPAERVERIRFDDVASMIRRTDLLARPFPRRAFAEDLAWARETLLAGRALAFCPAARVRHSHELSAEEFDSRTEQVHVALRELCDFVPMPSFGVFLRRVLATTFRFRIAALRAPGRTLGQRLMDLLTAPRWACMQMAAMRRGSLGARYTAPE